MMFLIAFVLPLILVLSPFCEHMGGLGKFATFIITGFVTLFLASLIEVSMQTPEEQKAAAHKQAEREVKELHEKWDKEAKEKAEKDFHNAMRAYR